MTDLADLLERVVAAIRDHAAAVTSGGDVAATIRAYDAVADEYAEALAALGAEPPWYADADDYDADAEPPGSPPAGERIAVRARADFVVTDPAALVAAATEARRRTWENDGEPPVVHVGEAVYELVHAAGPVLPMLDVPGLARGDALLVVHRTSTTVATEDDVAVVEGEEKLFELVERMEG